jgi:hypothetical protein
MALSVFDDPSQRPEARELQRALGKSAAHWGELVAYVAGRHGPLTEEWNHSGAKSGWSLRLKRKERVLLYLTPQEGRFLVGVVLGEKAVKSAHERGIPEAVLSLIDGAPKYPEGRGVRLPVAGRNALRVAKHLADAKMAP